MSDERPVIAIAAWRRPDQLSQLLAVLPSEGARALHIGIDGPPSSTRDVPGWLETQEVARNFQRQASVPVSVRTSPVNRGAAWNVPETVSEASHLASSVVVLEDDCRPTEAFLEWAPRMLQAYRDSPDIWAVCGSQYAPPNLMRQGHVLSRHFLGWGWAVDSQRWWEIRARLQAKPKLEPLGARMRPEDVYWYHGARRSFEGYVDAWDIPLVHALRQVDARCVLPSHNLVENRGFGRDATHTLTPTSGMLTPASDIIPAAGPPSLEESLVVDEWLAREHFGISPRHLVTTRATLLIDRLGRNSLRRRPLLEETPESTERDDPC